MATKSDHAAIGHLTIVAGSGVLPALLAAYCDRHTIAHSVLIFGDDHPLWSQGRNVIRARIEQPATYFAALSANGSTHVVFAGSMVRPALNEPSFDALFREKFDAFLEGYSGGDNRLLVAVVDIFEAQGFQIVGAHSLLGDDVMISGAPTSTQPSEADRRDAARAAEIVAGLGRLDVGQGAVVAQGLVAGLETIGGTDLMLKSVPDILARCRPNPVGARGVLFKAPKPQQDLRVDMPAIGPRTVTLAAQAGLAGVVIQEHGVMVLDRPETIKAADANGLFIWARPRIAHGP